ncbi:MAG: YHS domain-containing protein [Gammaproteobacteria bacterium]|nr:YHS domain-containing protein [Gammaproteobacteria bacterium]NNJ51233.1 YHS domain-containing protein [Gammaproteobacteria bacterium]
MLFRVAALISIVAMMSGCGAMTTQNPAGNLSPINGIANDSDDHLILFGADVVAYFTENRYVQGSADHRSEYQDVDFYFSSAGNKALFDADPTAYIPQYGGYCANGIVFGIPWGGNAEDFIVHQDKLYIFGGEISKQAFLLDLDNNLALSDRYWQEEVNGNNSFWQRTKRLIFRVPHYQNGEEQAAAVMAAQQAQ